MENNSLSPEMLQKLAGNVLLNGTSYVVAMQCPICQNNVIAIDSVKSQAGDTILFACEQCQMETEHIVLECLHID